MYVVFVLDKVGYIIKKIVFCFIVKKLLIVFSNSTDIREF